MCRPLLNAARNLFSKNPTFAQMAMAIPPGAKATATPLRSPVPYFTLIKKLPCDRRRSRGRTYVWHFRENRPDEGWLPGPRPASPEELELHKTPGERF